MAENSVAASDTVAMPLEAWKSMQRELEATRHLLEMLKRDKSLYIFHITRSASSPSPGFTSLWIDQPLADAISACDEAVAAFDATVATYNTEAAE